MVDGRQRCALADDCPQRRLKERRMVESMEKYRKETTEQFDLCDGTKLNSVAVLEGKRLNDGDWEFQRIQEKFRTELEEVPNYVKLCEPWKPSAEAADVLCPAKDILPCNFRRTQSSTRSNSTINKQIDVVVEEVFAPTNDVLPCNFRREHSFTSSNSCLSAPILVKAEIPSGEGAQLTNYREDTITRTNSIASSHILHHDSSPPGGIQKCRDCWTRSSQEIKRKEEEVPRSNRSAFPSGKEETVVQSNPEFPICDYRPPIRTSSCCTHISEKTISLNDSSRQSSIIRKETAPVPAPRRLSHSEKAWERQLLTSMETNPVRDSVAPEKPAHRQGFTRLSIQEPPRRSPSPRPRRSVSSAPPNYEMARVLASATPNVTVEGHDETFIMTKEPEKVMEPSNKSLSRRSTRTSMRTSIRSGESRFARVQSVSGSVRSRPPVYMAEQPSPRGTPEPKGDSRPRQRKITVESSERDPPFQHRNTPGPQRKSNGRPQSFNCDMEYPTFYEEPQVREETVTKETFERVTTTRKLWPSTYV